MARREIRTFNINSDDPVTIRKILIDAFPDFLRKCSKDRATHHIAYTELGNARFEKEYEYTIIDFAKATFYTPQPKIARRRLGVSKSDDT